MREGQASPVRGHTKSLHVLGKWFSQGASMQGAVRQLRLPMLACLRTPQSMHVLGKWFSQGASMRAASVVVTTSKTTFTCAHSPSLGQRGSQCYHTIWQAFVQSRIQASITGQDGHNRRAYQFSTWRRKQQCRLHGILEDNSHCVDICNWHVPLAQTTPIFFSLLPITPLPSHTHLHTVHFNHDYDYLP